MKFFDSLYAVGFPKVKLDKWLVQLSAIPSKAVPPVKPSKPKKK